MPLHDVLTSFSALIFILLLIFCARFLVKALERKRIVSGRGEGLLTVRERLDIDRTRRLTLVRVSGRDVLLLTGGPADIMLPCGGATRFKDMLENAEGVS